MGVDEGVEWETVTILLAQQRWRGVARPVVVRVKVGVVRTSTGTRIGLQVEDSPVIVVAPAGAASVIGALREALREM